MVNPGDMSCLLKGIHCLFWALPTPYRGLVCMSFVGYLSLSRCL